MILSHTPFEATKKPNNFPTNWIRICGKNKHNLQRDHAEEWKRDTQYAALAITQHISETIGGDFGVIFDGDNLEEGNLEEGGTELPSPFSVLIKELLQQGRHVIAVKNAKDEKVSRAFYDGWYFASAAAPDKMWIMLVHDADKADAAKHYASIGTCFYGSAYEDYWFKPGSEGAFTDGYRQLWAFRDDAANYDEIDLMPSRPNLMVFFKRIHSKKQRVEDPIFSSTQFKEHDVAVARRFLTFLSTLQGQSDSHIAQTLTGTNSLTALTTLTGVRSHAARGATRAKRRDLQARGEFEEWLAPLFQLYITYIAMASDSFTRSEAKGANKTSLGGNS